MTGPGSEVGGEDQEYPGANVDGSWVHYNYITTNRNYAIYLKHGMDCLYNHIVKAAYHAITIRGACASNCNIMFNRMTSGRQMAIQGWHHNIIGNYVRTTTGLQLSCEFRLNPTEKITRAARFSRVIGNDANQLVIGERRNGERLRLIAPLKNVIIEKHTGKYVRWIADGNYADIQLNSSGRFPSGFPYYDPTTITYSPTTNTTLVTPPILNETLCGPVSTRGKVWDR
jgi:hypothetical protein